MLVALQFRRASITAESNSLLGNTYRLFRELQIAISCRRRRTFSLSTASATSKGDPGVSVSMPTPESELFKSQKPNVAPTFNGVDYDDTKAFKAAEDAIIREQWVGAMKTRLVGEELGKCYMREGVNHLENCGELRGKWAGVFGTRRVYADYMGAQRNTCGCLLRTRSREPNSCNKITSNKKTRSSILLQKPTLLTRWPRLTAALDFLLRRSLRNGTLGAGDCERGASNGQSNKQRCTSGSPI